MDNYVNKGKGIENEDRGSHHTYRGRDKGRKAPTMFHSIIEFLVFFIKKMKCQDFFLQMNIDKKKMMMERGNYGKNRERKEILGP